MKPAFIALFLFFSLGVVAQPADTSHKYDFKLLPYQVVDGDTVLYYTFAGVTKIDSRDSIAQRKFLKLVRDVRKAMPYAKMAAFRLQMMEQNLAVITDKKQRARYIKETEQIIKKQFTDDLTKLSVSQGRVLIKLIHRETGQTTYEILSDHKGSASTFFWQTMAKMFHGDLKAEYDPEEDYQIEAIIKSLGYE